MVLIHLICLKALKHKSSLIILILEEILFFTLASFLLRFVTISVRNVEYLPFYIIFHKYRVCLFWSLYQKEAMLLPPDF